MPEQNDKKVPRINSFLESSPNIVLLVAKMKLKQLFTTWIYGISIINIFGIFILGLVFASRQFYEFVIQ